MCNEDNFKQMKTERICLKKAWIKINTNKSFKEEGNDSREDNRHAGRRVEN